MPTPLFVILVIAAVIAFLLFMRIKLYICYRGGFDYAVKYLFFTYRIKKQENGQAKKENKTPQKLNIAQIKQFIELFGRFYEDGKKVILKVGKKIRVDKIRIDLKVGGDDAAQTAITYGEVCAAIYPALSVLEGLVKIKKKQISLNADFNTHNSELLFDCHMSIRLGGILATGIASAVKILMSLIKNPINSAQRGVAK